MGRGVLRMGEGMPSIPTFQVGVTNSFGVIPQTVIIRMDKVARKVASDRFAA
jgi:hypothetical protein